MITYKGKENIHPEINIQQLLNTALFKQVNKIKHLVLLDRIILNVLSGCQQTPV